MRECRDRERQRESKRDNDKQIETDRDRTETDTERQTQRQTDTEADTQTERETQKTPLPLLLFNSLPFSGCAGDGRSSWSQYHSDKVLILFSFTHISSSLCLLALQYQTRKTNSAQKNKSIVYCVEEELFCVARKDDCNEADSREGRYVTAEQYCAALDKDLSRDLREYITEAEKGIACFSFVFLYPFVSFLSLSFALSPLCLLLSFFVSLCLSSPLALSLTLASRADPSLFPSRSSLSSLSLSSLLLCFSSPLFSPILPLQNLSLRALRLSTTCGSWLPSLRCLTRLSIARSVVPINALSSASLSLLQHLHSLSITPHENRWGVGCSDCELSREDLEAIATLRKLQTLALGFTGNYYMRSDVNDMNFLSVLLFFL